MTLDVESIVESRISGQKAPRQSRRLEPLQTPLSFADRLMRILGPVVFVLAPLAPRRKSKLAVGSTIEPEPVGDDPR
jgi:hypothetical protein